MISYYYEVRENLPLDEGCNHQMCSTKFQMLDLLEARKQAIEFFLYRKQEIQHNYPLLNNCDNGIYNCGQISIGIVEKVEHDLYGSEECIFYIDGEEESETLEGRFFENNVFSQLGLSPD